MSHPTQDRTTNRTASRAARADVARVALLSLAGAAVAGLLGGCTSGPSPSPSPIVAETSGLPSAAPSSTTPPSASPNPTDLAAAFARNPAPYVEGASYAQVLEPADFVAGIDHPFLPFTPGARFVFDGDEHVEVEVLAETRVILGITATVVRDRVFDGEELIEDTLDWYAQDRDGNVWYMGEQTAEYANGEVVSTHGTWEAGVDGALPGIVMLAEPEAGDVYRQEFYAGEAEDVASITAISGEISVPAGSWSGDDVLVTEEWTPLQPDVRERKTYVRGYGVVEIRTIKGGNEVTTLSAMTTAALAPAPIGLIALASLPLVSRLRIQRRSPGSVYALGSR